MCRGCTGINIGEVCFQIWGEQGHTFGFMGRLDSGHVVHFLFFLRNKGLYPKIIMFVYILIRREGGNFSQSREEAGGGGDDEGGGGGG